MGGVVVPFRNLNQVRKVQAGVGLESCGGLDQERQWWGGPG